MRSPFISVHPRVCGELAEAQMEYLRSCGSSPRVWGTRTYTHWTSQNFRFIPACVGNSPPKLFQEKELVVHPRVCGELPEGGDAFPVYFGSSPRVWGTQPKPPRLTLQVRFIPACVGNSPPKLFQEKELVVHPRVCGELPEGGDAFPVYFGSSPRVWGTQPKPPRLTLQVRFIPACVGNSEAHSN